MTRRFQRIFASATEWRAMTDEQIEEIMCASEGEWSTLSDGLSIPKKILMGFLEGYHIGITWPDKWESHSGGNPNPGGPFVSRMRDPRDRYQWVIDPISEGTNAAWRRGWKYGHDIKLATGRRNPLRAR